MAVLLDGKRAAKELRAAAKREVGALAARGVSVGLAVVLVGEDPASRIYVRNKKCACERAGIRSFDHPLPADVSQEALLALVDRLNADPSVNGVLVQLPLPAHIAAERVLERIAPEKDVDGFHPENVGRLTMGRPRFVPCTPAGIVHLLDRYEVPLRGRAATIVGRSNIVGKPMAALLMARDATVTVCHSRTVDLPERVAAAEIVIAAVGRAELVRGDWIRPGAVVIDVGINRRNDGTLCGDVAFDEAAARAGAITPVPGGVGPMTIASLLGNTLLAARMQAGIGA